ncbi:hypothetical protein HaLaN_21747, partial [Haematococcus lacustris]
MPCGCGVGCGVGCELVRCCLQDEHPVPKVSFRSCHGRIVLSSLMFALDFDELVASGGPNMGLVMFMPILSQYYTIFNTVYHIGSCDPDRVICPIGRDRSYYWLRNWSYDRI